MLQKTEYSRWSQKRTGMNPDTAVLEVVAEVALVAARQRRWRGKQADPQAGRHI